MPVQANKFVIAKSDLGKLDDASARLFVMACHIANEVASLQRILVAAIQAKPTSEMGKVGYVTQSLVISKLLAGKLREARNALDKYYFSGPSKTLGQRTRPLDPERFQRHRMS